MARIIVAGYLVRYPLGGQLWHHLQYVLGLRQLGHDVYFFEEYGWPDSCYDLPRNRLGDDASYGLCVVRELMERFGLGEHWVFRAADGAWHGRAGAHAREIIAHADLLVNLSGVSWFDGFERIPSRVYMDEDPGFTQFRAASDLEFAQMLRGHTRHFSWGHCIGKAGCSIPTLGLAWQPFRQPIALEEWPAGFDANADTFTTVMSWSAYGNIEFEGKVYGQKGHEFPKVMSLPRHTPQPFELATSGDDVPLAELRANGWRVCDPLRVSQSLDAYRDYIAASRGEFSVAKHCYVATCSGWFSDRSAAYLASGKPVILQDTGYSSWLPAGEGLIAFADLSEALSAVEVINADYERHCRAARAIAEAFFDARVLLGRLVDSA